MKPVASHYPDTLNTLGDQIRKKRLELGLRQKDVANELGVSTDSVAYWENNRYQPSLRMVPRIIEFLGYAPNLGDRTGETPGERILQVRRARGVRQKDLARQLGVDPGTLAKWEHAQSTPRSENRELIEAFITSAIGVYIHQWGPGEDP